LLAVNHVHGLRNVSSLQISSRRRGAKFPWISFLPRSRSVPFSNLTFGPIQLRIAQDLGVSLTTMLALQTVGAAMGNMVAIHNIVAVCAVLGLKNEEGNILKKTFIPTLVYGIILAALAGLWLLVS
jgi:lactate permease